MPLSPSVDHTIDPSIYTTAKAAYANFSLGAPPLNHAKYKNNDVLSSFSAQAIWTMLGLPNSYDPSKLKEKVVGISFFFAWKDEALVLVARASNSKNQFFKNSNYLISAGEMDESSTGDTDFKNWLVALKTQTITNVLTPNITTYKFSKRLLYELAFKAPPADLSETEKVTLELVLGPCEPEPEVPTNEIWLNLATQTAGAYMLGEGCPDKCYYQVVFVSLKQMIAE